MYVKELWRYPVKSMAGERLARAEVGPAGIEGDRTVLVHNADRIITARTHHRLLALKGTMGNDGVPRISGHAWDSPEALALVQAASGPDARPFRFHGLKRFDVLPLLVATDGAIEYLGLDSRRLRPNIVIGGVEGLQERDWPGRILRIGTVAIHIAKLRGRCVMTTYDPDTLQQDVSVLRRIVKEFDSTMALDCRVINGGTVEENSVVTLEE